MIYKSSRSGFSSVNFSELNAININGSFAIIKDLGDSNIQLPLTKNQYDNPGSGSTVNKNITRTYSFTSQDGNHYMLCLPITRSELSAALPKDYYNVRYQHFTGGFPTYNLYMKFPAPDVRVYIKSYFVEGREDPYTSATLDIVYFAETTGTSVSYNYELYNNLPSNVNPEMVNEYCMECPLNETYSNAIDPPIYISTCIPFRCTDGYVQFRFTPSTTSDINNSNTNCRWTTTVVYDTSPSSDPMTWGTLECATCMTSIKITKIDTDSLLNLIKDQKAEITNLSSSIDNINAKLIPLEESVNKLISNETALFVSR